MAHSYFLETPEQDGLFVCKCSSEKLHLCGLFSQTMCDSVSNKLHTNNSYKGDIRIYLRTCLNPQFIIKKGIVMFDTDYRWNTKGRMRIDETNLWVNVFFYFPKTTSELEVLCLHTLDDANLIHALKIPT